ncbi:ribosomal protein S18-alanine N-acetyltransferase [Persephonella atlantica]|uniref:[Ribosomal protein bS18]-alanine N-acetyltransferase n=1 Tax=Persephonella atlantica TaxID=2699429 RepID=A0ABS1GFW7_9AQUI|nr:ribosomal protein S18-alanine N-acetyltransferase [Persephonella atlantica]MBK3331817.1 ribosomal protein S18-alanine N-acetyltransferase [Persephonella atlantica]
MKKIRITDFSPEHLPEVKEILSQNFYSPWTDHHILSKNPFTVKKIILFGDTVIGFFAGEVIFGEASITMIAVKKDFQGKGIGSQVLNWFKNYAKEKGAKNIWLEVSVNNKKAVRFYEKHGFFTQDIRKNYYSDGSDALVMKCSLL